MYLSAPVSDGAPVVSGVDWGYWGPCRPRGTTRKDPSRRRSGRKAGGRGSSRPGGGGGKVLSMAKED